MSNGFVCIGCGKPLKEGDRFYQVNCCKLEISEDGKSPFVYFQSVIYWECFRDKKINDLQSSDG